MRRLRGLLTRSPLLTHRHRLPLPTPSAGHDCAPAPDTTKPAADTQPAPPQPAPATGASPSTFRNLYANYQYGGNKGNRPSTASMSIAPT